MSALLLVYFRIQPLPTMTAIALPSSCWHLHCELLADSSRWRASGFFLCLFLTEHPRANLWGSSHRRDNFFKIPQWLPNRFKTESKSLFSAALCSPCDLARVRSLYCVSNFPCHVLSSPAILAPFLVFKSLQQAHMQVDSQSAVEVSLPEIFFSHVGLWLIPSAHLCLFLTLTVSAVRVTQLYVMNYKPHSLQQSPPPALHSRSPHTLSHFRMFSFTQGQVQESKCKPSFTDKRSEIINLWEEGPASFCFCFRHLALGPGCCIASW